MVQKPADVKDRRMMYVQIVLAIVASILWLEPVISSNIAASSDAPRLQQEDFITYYAPACLVLAKDGKDVYQLDRFLEFERSIEPQLIKTKICAQPPMTIPLFSWIAFFQEKEASIMWSIVNALAAAISIELCRRIFGLNSLFTLVLAVLFFDSGPYHSAMKLGQLSTQLLLAYLLAIYGVDRKRPWFASFALAFLLIKPQWFVPLGAILLGGGKFGILIRTFLILCCLTLATLPAFGIEAYSAYFQLNHELMVHPQLIQVYRAVTVEGQLVRFVFRDLSHYIPALSALTILGLISVLFFSYKFRHDPKWLRLILLTSPVSIVTLAYFQHYDTVLLLPFALAFYFELYPVLQKPLKQLALVALFVFLNPTYHFIQRLIEDHSLQTNPVFVVIMFLALLISSVLVRKQSVERATEEQA